MGYVVCRTLTLARSLANGKTTWSGIGDYHSQKLAYNQPYENSVHITYKKLTTVTSI